MRRNQMLPAFLGAMLLATGCIETYDMDKLSKQAHLSPTLGVAAVKGDVTLADVVDPDDTVRYDTDGFVRLVFREDSVIEKVLEDFYDLEDLVSYTDTYVMGELSISPFTGSYSYTLDQITQRFSPSLRAQFLALDDGANHPFPAFPTTNMGELTFPAFSNFEYAVLKSGFLDISVKNNLTAPLNTISISLYNTAGNTPIGSALTVPAIQPGQTQTVSLNLADVTITNLIKALVVLAGSPGTSTPVRIDLDVQNIQITIRGRDLKVKSGRVILPTQVIETLDKKDTIDFDPGDDVEVDEIKTISGAFDYRVQSGCPLKASLEFKLPDALRSGTPLTEFITILPNSIQYGTIPINNTVFNLTKDPDQPYNRLPLEYNLTVGSEGSMVDFNSTDQITLNLDLSNPDLDYVRGYFGQQSESIDPDSLVLEIEEILDGLTGEYFIASPVVRVAYRNSFAVPIEVTLNVNGNRGSEVVNLGLLPFILASPVAPGSRDIAGTYVIDKNNSSLPALISLPPEVVRYSGSVKMNPANAGSARNNYVFGNSRFVADLEVELPLEFRINNLQFTDTVDNFLQTDEGEGDSELSTDDFEMLRIDLVADNGFPLGISAALSLYDPVTNKVKATVEATDLLKPAPVGTNGRVTGVATTETSILFNEQFIESINDSDEIIFRFKLNTTNGATQNIKIYSDYNIKFKAALVVKPDIYLK